MKPSRSQHSLAERTAWINVYRSGNQSLREVAARAGVSHQTLYKWVKGKIKSPAVRSKNMSGKPESTQPKMDPRDAEILRLKAELEQAKLQAHAYDTMIKIAEKELNISIRKKAGAKQ